MIAAVEGGIELAGTIILKGGLNAAFKARYHQRKFEANLTPELDLELLLRLALTAYVLAQAGFGWLRSARAKIGRSCKRRSRPAQRFFLSAPFRL